MGEDITDAIVENGDAEAIAALLGNDSAQVREETLDRIVDQASGEPTWHKPLVHRPNLHAAAAMRIAEIVAGPLLVDLRNRTELDDATISAIKQVVLRRLESEDFSAATQTAPQTMAKSDGADNDAAPRAEGNVLEAEQSAAKKGGDAPVESKESVVTKRVREMYLNGELTEHEISSALASGGNEFVVYSIALKSKTPVEVVARAISMGSAKAIVALCWKAELSMRLATRVQMQLANIPPGDVLRATSADDFPLSQEEMRWQLEFLSGLATAR